MSKVSANLQTPVNNGLSRRGTLVCQTVSWLLVVVVCTLAITTWGQYNAWRLGSLNTYQIFPVLGLLAFSIMWTHYITGTMRRLLNIDKSAFFCYFNVTGWIVLLLICLHPGLLMYQRFRDGYGLPPHSYETYVRPGLGWVTLVGSVSLLAFLAYELRRFYSSRPWWHYLQIATDLAMVAIFYHALRLGDELQTGWFVKVWWFYGVTLGAVLIYDYNRKYIQPWLKPKV